MTKLFRQFLAQRAISLSCQTQSVLQDLFFGRNVCVFIHLYIYIFIYLYIYILVFLLQFFQISTRSVDHSFSAIVLKLANLRRMTGGVNPPGVISTAKQGLKLKNLKS